MDDILFDFIYLNVKCPLCEKSLMDEDFPVDGSPGIKLIIKTKKDTGIIRLSSIYESYNYRCDVEIPPKEIVHFTCPYCNKEITSSNECETCDAPMTPLLLDIGGKVSICSRAGCSGHFLEFDDISLALKKLYHLGDFIGPLPEGLEETDESKEIIESGSFLHTYCPHCKRTILEKGLVKLKVIRGDDETGFVFLSPYLNVFTTKSTMVLHEDQVVKDLKCFHCDTSFIEKGEKCGECGSPAAKIAISARTKLIDFYLCSKKGCTWHGLSKADLHDIDLEDSMEW